MWIRIQRKMRKPGSIKGSESGSPALVFLKRIKHCRAALAGAQSGGAGPVHQKVVGSVPVGALMRGNLSVFFSLSLCLPVLLLLSLKKNQ